MRSHESSQRTSSREPTHFSDAETWGQAYDLLAPWAVFEVESGSHGGLVIFSNLGSIEGAWQLYDEMNGSGSWNRGKARALTAVDSNPHLLQHVGALAATVVMSDTAFTFFGVAANLYQQCTGTPGPWVFETISQPKCGGGTCHTEQICLWRLHQHLISLGGTPTSITLQWYTEKKMCTQWCVPTLNLFTEYWTSKGASVHSIPSDKL
ncbi:hypothetical protein [Paraliomyxa miuraensis]|uniref:hypothetical protein n=1 Tax=Paraliomyxa miuraensis TaxID=376150 RepID=UPI00224E011E|nr:hypothetical protein [Paraliomyxa miuraensis]MCX4244140.1 hypothetical protein [Paraliomyxa miuraensis]